MNETIITDYDTYVEDEAEVVTECACCGDFIYAGEEYVYLEDEDKSVCSCCLKNKAGYVLGELGFKTKIA